MAKSNRPPRRSAWEDGQPDATVEVEASAANPLDGLPDTWGEIHPQALPDTWAGDETEMVMTESGPAGEGGQVQAALSPAAANPGKAILPNNTVAMLRGIAAPQTLEAENEPARRTRNRDWDKAHNGEVVCFRSIPAAVHESILWLADDQQVSVGQIARALLEYALDGYQKGVLSFTPELSGGKRTLFPNGQKMAGWSRNNFKRTAKTIGRKKARTKKRKGTDLISVNYREIPKTLQTTLRKIAAERDVPLTEVARFFFQYALTDLEKGALVLTPIEV